MFKVNDTVQQIKDAGVSKAGMIGTVRSIEGTYANVFFPQLNAEFLVQMTNLKASAATIDGQLADLIATANKGAAALRTLIQKYPGKLHYNSPKFQKGQDHLCEKATRIVEFDVVVKNVKVIAFPTLTFGNLTFNQSQEDQEIIEFDGEEFEATELYQAFNELLQGEPESMGFTATRKGIACDNGVLAWADAERVVNAFKTSGLITA